MRLCLACAVSFFATCAPINSALAEVHLSINPTDGSNSLRFERYSSGLDIKKGLRLRIASSGGKRYQIFQRMAAPIVNEKGESLDLQAIEMAAVFNSNASGTLYLQNGDHLSYSEQLIYSSGQGGEGDSFLLDYAVRQDQLHLSGNFIGELIFTVRVIDNGEQQQSVINISVDSSAAWRISVQGGRKAGSVSIKDTDTSEQTADFVKIAFSGNSGNQVRIFQEVDALPQDMLGQELADGAIQFGAAASYAQNVKVPDPSSLIQERKLIYSGSPTEDNLAIYFWMNTKQGLQPYAGTYTGRLKYFVETDSTKDEFSVDLESVIKPIFAININLPTEGVSFTNVLPNTPPQEKEVMVSVQSNIHQPYQVSQIMSAPMTNEAGKEINKEYLTVKVEIPGGQKGQTKFNEFMPIETGEYPIFSSDTQGSSAAFKVIYRLQGYAQLSPGNFGAPVKFSLNQN